MEQKKSLQKSREQILHDFKKIAQLMRDIYKAYDKLYFDIEEVLKNAN